MRGVPRTPRCLDLVNVAWGSRLRAAEGQELSDSQLRNGFFVDLSQGCDRHPWGDLSVFATGTALTRTLSTYLLDYK